MAYSATLTPSGTYQVSQDGKVISTTAASGLANYGLSTTQLSTPAPTASNPTPSVAPTAIGTQTTNAATATPPAQTNTSDLPPGTHWSDPNGYHFSGGQSLRGGGQILNADGTPYGSTPTPASTPTPSTAGNVYNSTVGPGGVSTNVTNTTGMTPVTLGNGSKVFVDNQGKFYDASGNPISNQTVAGSTAGTAPIPSTIPAPTLATGTTPPSTQGTAAQALSAYTSSIQATLDAQTAQLAAANTQQIQNYQTQIDSLNQQNTQLQDLMNQGMVAENSLVQQEAQQKQAALQLEMQQYQENYNAIQGLAAEAQALVQTSGQLLDQMRNTTGLSSIMKPRIDQTASDLTARLAIIKGAVDIYSGQIGAAQNQLKAATNAITSIYSDQINYYNNLINFYGAQKSENISQLGKLTADQKTYIDANIKILQSRLDSTQATADYITKAMVDPSTALTYAKAGVTLNDTIPQINAKLATYQAQQQAQAQNDAMTKAGYSTTPIVGAPYEKITDQYGKTWYKEVPANANTADNSATVGSDLADAKAYLEQYGGTKDAATADTLRQRFLAKHPGSAKAWDDYFTPTIDNKDNLVSYPASTTAATTDKKPWWQFW